MPDDGTMKVRVHAAESTSRANGPGLRYVLWFQGCDLGCPGCFNPETHAPQGPESTVAEVVAKLLDKSGSAQGVTLSGGEPFQQPEALLAIVTAIRKESELSILVFSGYSRKEIESQALGPQILEKIDVLVDGRYVKTQRVAENLRGSQNQHVHLLSDRYTHDDVAETPVAEVKIGPDGLVTLTGVDPLVLD